MSQFTADIGRCDDSRRCAGARSNGMFVRLLLASGCDCREHGGAFSSALEWGCLSATAAWILLLRWRKRREDRDVRGLGVTHCSFTCDCFLRSNALQPFASVCSLSTVFFGPLGAEPPPKLAPLTNNDGLRSASVEEVAAASSAVSICEIFAVSQVGGGGVCVS